MKVNLIYEPGWILERFAKQLQKHLDYVVLQDSPNKHKINYFLPYYLLQKGSWKSVGWFTHREERPDLKAKFKWSALNADFCIVQAKQYLELINGWGIKNTKQIIPGVSLNRYKPKLILGYVGRMYTSTDRKNPEMLNFVSSLPYVELRCTDGKIKEKDMPDFYNGLDAVFVPSKIEGGPMCLYEGLACGKQVIAPAGVGVVNEYSAGIIKYKNEDFSSAKNVIKKIYDKKMLLRKQVEKDTWKKFALEHDKVFGRFF